MPPSVSFHRFSPNFSQIESFKAHAHHLLNTVVILLIFNSKRLPLFNNRVSFISVVFMFNFTAFIVEEKRVMCSLDALSATIDFTRSQDWNHKFVVLGGAETWCFVLWRAAKGSAKLDGTAGGKHKRVFVLQVKLVA